MFFRKSEAEKKIAVPLMVSCLSALHCSSLYVFYLSTIEKVKARISVHGKHKKNKKQKKFKSAYFSMSTESFFRTKSFSLTRNEKRKFIFLIVILRQDDFPTFSSAFAQF